MRAERQAQVIALRRDQRLSMREIAARTGWSHETVRRDISGYISRLDAACLEGVAAMRAEEYERLEHIASLLDQAIADGDLTQVPAAVKTSESIRRLYALDLLPMSRNELALRRSIITEIASKLRDQLQPDTFAEVATILVENEPIALLDGIAIEDGDAPSASSPRRRIPGPRSSARHQEAPGNEAVEPDTLTPTELVDAGD